MKLVVNILDILILLYVLYLQVKNLVKYGKADGALRVRVLMIFCIMFLIVHITKLLFDKATGLFLFMHVSCWLLIYADAEIRILTNSTLQKARDAIRWIKDRIARLRKR